MSSDFSDIVCYVIFLCESENPLPIETPFTHRDRSHARLEVLKMHTQMAIRICREIMVRITAPEGEVADVNLKLHEFGSVASIGTSYGTWPSVWTNSAL